MLEVKGRPLIEYVLARAEKIAGVAATIVATTTRAVDDPLIKYLDSQSVPYFRGDLEDVSKRVLECAIANDADYFIRLNGDSPLLDYQLIGEGVALCQGTQPDLVSNLPDRTYPYGIAVEIIRTSTFLRAYKQMLEAEYREHVTKYLYVHPEQFQIITMTSLHPELAEARLVVDTLEDFRMFESMVDVLGVNVDTACYPQVATTYLQLKRR